MKDGVNNLEDVTRAAAESASRYRRGRYGVDELVNEAWVWTHEPSRAATIKHHMENTFGGETRKWSMGEIRLFRLLRKMLCEWMDEQDGKAPPVPTVSSQQEVEFHYGSRLGMDDYGVNLIDEAFPYSGEQYNRGFSWQHVNHVPAKKFDPRYGDARRFLLGKYGKAQKRPFGIIDYALSAGVISKHQAELLEYMMNGDSASDLACRFPLEAANAIQTNVSVALKALRHDPRVKAWGESLGFNPEAVKGRRFESEHRHDDGREAGPEPSRPFVCTCDRANGQDEIMDRSASFSLSMAG
jgi:hypothetical protein